MYRQPASDASNAQAIFGSLEPFFQKNNWL